MLVHCELYLNMNKQNKHGGCTSCVDILSTWSMCNTRFTYKQIVYVLADRGLNPRPSALWPSALPTELLLEKHDGAGENIDLNRYIYIFVRSQLFNLLNSGVHLHIYYTSTLHIYIHNYKH